MQCQSLIPLFALYLLLQKVRAGSVLTPTSKLCQDRQAGKSLKECDKQPGQGRQQEVEFGRSSRQGWCAPAA